MLRIALFLSFFPIIGLISIFGICRLLKVKRVKLLLYIYIIFLSSSALVCLIILNLVEIYGHLSGWYMNSFWWIVISTVSMILGYLGLIYEIKKIDLSLRQK
jgi:hypothetical protein